MPMRKITVKFLFIFTLVIVLKMNPVLAQGQPPEAEDKQAPAETDQGGQDKASIEKWNNLTP